MSSITGAILILAGVTAAAGQMELLGLAIGVVGFIYLVAGIWRCLWVEVPGDKRPQSPTRVDS